MSDNQRREQIWRIFDNPKYSLKAPRQDNMEKDPKLSVGIYEDNPRFRVKTQIPNDKNNGNIDAAFSGPGFFAFLRLIEFVAHSKEPIEQFAQLDGHPFINGQRSRDKLPMSKVRIAKDQEGLITLTVTAGMKRPVIDFPFLLDEYHHFQDANGNPMPVAIASKIVCLGWVDTIRNLITAEIVKHTAKPEWMSRNDNYQGNQQNRGGYQNQNRGGYGGGGNSGYGDRDRGGYNNQQGGSRGQQPYQQTDNMSFDEDVPL